MKCTDKQIDISANCCIIIPAWQEEDNIFSVCKSVRDMGFNVVVINDASTDETATRAMAAGATVIHHPYNMGYASALQTGYNFALDKGYTTIVQMDGDGQHDPADIPKLFAKLQEDGADIVVGSRFLGVGDYHMPMMRRWGQYFFRFLTRLLCGRDFSDPTSGYQALSRAALLLYTSDWFADEYPDADMLILASKQGLRISEVGVSMRADTTGKSMHSGFWHPLWYILRVTLGCFIAMQRRSKT